MGSRDVFLPVASQPSVAHLIDWSQTAQRLGYHRVWMPETWGRDVVTVLATIAANTDRIGIGASVANVYSRSPALLGQTAATLQEISDDRFRLGVGPSGPILVEGWHGVAYDRPLRRTRETIEIVRLVLGGEEVEYVGEIFRLAGFRLRQDPPENSPPVDAAGLRSKAVELAGRFGDGWHALFLSPSGLRERVGDFERGASLGDRSREDQRVTFGLTCCALEDRDRARRLVREHLVFYIGAMGTFYRETLAEQGYEAEANSIASLVASGERADAVAALTDEILDTFAVAGTPSECRNRLGRFADVDGVDAIAVSFPRGANPGEIAATIDACAPRS